MIRILNKRDCCGCEACVQVCPKQCIEFTEDKQGFGYPRVDESICINCGLCEKSCPVLNAKNGVYQDSVPTYAAFNKSDEERKTSSSGGLFSLLANEVFDEKGIVFGAMFDEKWNVVHGCIGEKDKLEKLKRSKYVQSKISNNYIKVKKFLNEGKLVLFVGTPCQIAGLRGYLRKEYSNLLTVDVVCHGVPSPMIWQKYLAEKIQEFASSAGIKDNNQIEVVDISFRSKEPSWRRFHLLFNYKIKSISSKGEDSMLQTKSTYIWEDDYMLSFLHDFINRPSCFSCKFRNGNCHSDITLADFWSIEKWTELENFACDKGTSMVLLHTDKGKNFFKKLDAPQIQLTLEKAVYGNPALLRSWLKPRGHGLYFMLCRFLSVSNTYKIVNCFQEIINYIYNLKLQLKGVIKKILKLGK